MELNLHFWLRRLRLRELRHCQVSHSMSAQSWDQDTDFQIPSPGVRIKAHVQQGLRGGVLAIHQSPERQGTSSPAKKPSRTLLPVSFFLMPRVSLCLHWQPLPLAPLSLGPTTGSPRTHPEMHFLDVARCYSHGPRAKSFVANSGLFAPCQPPSLIFRACHSQLPASHPGPGKEMRPRNSGAEPPTAREMLTHSQCILTQRNSQESQRAVPGLLRAQLSILLQAWN